MNRKHLTGNCTECGGPLRYPADLVGTVSRCPHCGQQTELLLAEPETTSTLPRRAIVWTIVAVIILGGGLIATIVALKKAQTWARQNRPPAQVQTAQPKNPLQTFPSPAIHVEQDGFGISSIRLERAPGGSLGRAAGFATNLLSRPRHRVSLQLDLLDAAGAKIGIAMDTAAAIQPGAVWSFAAPVLLTNATRAQVGSIKEQP